MTSICIACRKIECHCAESSRPVRGCCATCGCKRDSLCIQAERMLLCHDCYALQLNLGDYTWLFLSNEWFYAKEMLAKRPADFRFSYYERPVGAERKRLRAISRSAWYSSHHFRKQETTIQLYSAIYFIIQVKLTLFLFLNDCPIAWNSVLTEYF